MDTIVSLLAYHLFQGGGQGGGEGCKKAFSVVDTRIAEDLPPEGAPGVVTVVHEEGCPQTRGFPRWSIT